jgi:hypothetical protein
MACTGTPSAVYDTPQPSVVKLGVVDVGTYWADRVTQFPDTVTFRVISPSTTPIRRAPTPNTVTWPGAAFGELMSGL